jgi:hypothetical protein
VEADEMAQANRKVNEPEFDPGNPNHIILRQALVCLHDEANSSGNFEEQPDDNTLRQIIQASINVFGYHEGEIDCLVHELNDKAPQSRAEELKGVRRWCLVQMLANGGPYNGVFKFKRTIRAGSLNSLMSRDKNAEGLINSVLSWAADSWWQLEAQAAIEERAERSASQRQRPRKKSVATRSIGRHETTTGTTTANRRTTMYAPP